MEESDLGCLAPNQGSWPRAGLDERGDAGMDRLADKDRIGDAAPERLNTLSGVDGVSGDGIGKAFLGTEVAGYDLT